MNEHHPRDVMNLFLWKDGRRDWFDGPIHWGSSGQGQHKCTQFVRDRFLPPSPRTDSGVYVERDFQPSEGHYATEAEARKLMVGCYQQGYCDACLALAGITIRSKDPHAVVT